MNSGNSRPVEPGRARPRGRRARRARSAALALAAVTVAAVAAGCAVATAPVHGAATAHAAARPAAGARAAGTSQAGAKAAATCDPAAASLAPLGPPEVTPGSYMARIKARGYLIAGVDQSTYHFGYLNPLDGQIEGFDIDMIRAVAQAIFGSPDKVEFKSISDAQRIPAITSRSGSVDIVAHTMTITCDRLKQVDFSSVYFDAHQRVLVPDNSAAAGGLADLGGQKVCATEGSDSVTTIQDYPTHPKVVQEPFWTDCLVLLQQDQVAAVSTDDAILYGLQAQDPFTKVVGPELTDEPYGLAMSKQHPDFVRFVNAVLAREESDGSWEKSYQHWVSPVYQKPPVPEYAG
jgi:polar amino acid transport system substrate-binding protein